MGPEIRARLGLDSKDWQRGLTDAQRSSERFKIQTRKSFEGAGEEAASAFKRKFGVGDVFKSLLAGVGLFSADKFADKIGRFFTGFSEESEKALQRIGDASTKLADVNIENMRRTLSDEQRYQLLLKDRERVLKRAGTPRDKDPWYVTAGKVAMASGWIGGLKPVGKQMLENDRNEEALVKQADSLEGQAKQGDAEKEIADLKKKIADQKADAYFKRFDAEGKVANASGDLETAKSDRGKYTLADLAQVQGETGTTLGNQAASARKFYQLQDQAKGRTAVGDVNGANNLLSQADKVRGGLSLLKSDEKSQFKPLEDKLTEAIEELRKINEGQKGLILLQ